MADDTPTITIIDSSDTLDDMPSRSPSSSPGPCDGREPANPVLSLSISPDRYTEQKKLGKGGAGTVSAQFDPNLGRTVAMKELHAELDGQCRQRARFFREARITAQLEHPNIIPVHELGISTDGRIYYTMKRVRGLTLQAVLNGIKDGDEQTIKDFPLIRLLEVFRDICQGIAFAHARGIIHRDLKPENIMLGDFGETLITDWGLVKILNDDSDLQDVETEQAVNQPSGPDALKLTMEGSVSGTPLHMAPEQALGQVKDLDQRSDIYSLGTILYEILALKKTVTGKNLTEIMTKVVKGEIIPPRANSLRKRVPRDLDAVCMKCLAFKQEGRYQAVVDILRDLTRYQQNLPVSARRYSPLSRFWKLAQRHPVASSSIAVGLIVVAVLMAVFWTNWYSRRAVLYEQASKARLQGSLDVATLFLMADELNTMEAKNTAKQIPDEQQKLMDDLANLEGQAELSYRSAVLFYTQFIATCNGQVEDRVEKSLLEIFRNRIEYALKLARYDDARRMMELIEQFVNEHHLQLSPSFYQELDILRADVKGDGALSITTNPPGAALHILNLKQFKDDGHPVAVDLGSSPLAKQVLPKGRYLLTANLAGRHEVRLPVHIKHSEDKIVTIELPSEIPTGMAYVPAGDFLMGGDDSKFHRLHERKLPAFFIKQTEVTFADYLEFWQAAGGPDADPELMSRVQLRSEDRRFENAWDTNGVLRPEFSQDMPVVGITQKAATAYCFWKSEKAGREVRLPTAGEWEKAARGTDGRRYVWGDIYRPGLAFTVEEKEARARFGIFAPGGQFPHDRSLYGIYDMAGNVREWTLSPYGEDTRLFQIKGASASTPIQFLPCSAVSDTPVVPTDVGFRYIMPYNPELDQ